MWSSKMSWNFANTDFLRYSQMKQMISLYPIVFAIFQLGLFTHIFGKIDCCGLLLKVALEMMYTIN